MMTVMIAVIIVDRDDEGSGKYDQHEGSFLYMMKN